MTMAVAGSVALAPPVHAIASRTVAFYSMDEARGATVLRDSSGNGRDGTIGADVTSGVVVAGATAQRFATHLPSDGAFPGHVDRVPATTAFNPDTGDFSIEVRLRTTYPFGNIMQKGQGTAAGGYWKLENPAGKPRCLFRGSNGESRTGYSTVEIDDGQWHVIHCNRTSTFVEMYVDGVRQSRLTGSTGTISNSWGLSIGGKGECDGVTVTCDYFVGDIDYVRIEKGAATTANVPPVAVSDVDCTGLICAMSGSASTDSDGAIQRYAWSFGDGSAYDGVSVPTVTHTYASAGTYTVTLTVTDDRGASSATTRQVSVAPAAETISFVGQSTSNANATTHSVVVPGAVRAGDTLLLFVSQNNSATLSGPTGVTGWTRLDRVAQGYGATTAWVKVAAAGDAGAAARVSFSSTSKANVVLAAYHGTDPGAPVDAFAGMGDPVSSAARVTPMSAVTHARSWAVSYWMHGDSTSTSLAPPSDVAVRSNGSQTGSGRVTGLLADTAAGLPTAPYGGKVATGATASTTNTTWTVILRPDDGGTQNEPPTASFQVDCADLTCTFDGSASNDPDGALASYAWEFGDGDTRTTSNSTVSHTYAAAGSYEARLVVTDDGGLTDGTTRTFDVSAPPPEPSSVDFVAAASANATASTHTVTVPAAVRAGDTLLLYLGIASASTITDPAGGWQRLDTVDNDKLRTSVWWKTAAASDAGASVSVGLGASAKGNLMVAAYRGVAPRAPLFRSAVSAGDSAVRTTPDAPVAVAGSWAVSYWAHRDGSTTALVPPTDVQPRSTGTQSGGGRVTTLLADSAGSVATGSYGGKSATAAATSSYGVTWTVVLAPEG
ncbi:MAG: PKD domain-containing protein [Propionicimonas sp.]|uniref:PKD domain-containing protein n=1 Tax=Propionicimonas sp. TaxID=1955623 RepID=UPI003D1374A6